MWSLQTGSWENWQKPAKGENSSQSRRSQVSAVPGLSVDMVFGTLKNITVRENILQKVKKCNNYKFASHRILM